MGNDHHFGTGGDDAVTVRRSGRRGGGVGICGREASIENISKVIGGAKGSHLHQDSGSAGVRGRRRGASYGGCWPLRLHPGEELYASTNVQRHMKW